jgi:predicted permease
MQQARLAATVDSPLSDLFAFGPISEMNARVGEDAEIINGQAVSGNYYSGLKLQPSLGRVITDEDDKSGATPVVVLSDRYWQSRFGANTSVIGRQLILNKRSFTIIGVTPRGFTGTSQVDYQPAVTIPLAHEPWLMGENSRQGTLKSPGVWWLNLIGRLKAGATSAQARESLNLAFQSAALQVMPPPRRADDSAQLDPKDYPCLITESGSQGMQDNRREYAPTIYGLFILVGLVLLIACANLANLLLARATLRVPEIGVRLAVGAGRWRLLRQLLTESLLLAVLGGAVGLFFAFWAKTALLALTDKDIHPLPTGVDLSLNGRVLVFTFLISLLTALVFGLVPAWRATSLDLTTALKRNRRTTGGVTRLSKGLLVLQVALSVLLLVGASLFIRLGGYMYDCSKKCSKHLHDVLGLLCSSVNGARKFLQNLYSSVRFRSPPPTSPTTYTGHDRKRVSVGGARVTIRSPTNTRWKAIRPIARLTGPYAAK